MNLPITGNMYHTGIKRDDNQVWRRVSDGVEVNLDGWQPHYPDKKARHVFLFWDIWYANTIYNFYDQGNEFICEY